ncbi:MAG TPA: DNA circularization N-terminal domain-containing protein [Thermodesulfobacteriota bacterium]
MAWRDQLRKVRFGNRDLVGASWRGAPFFVDAADLEVGRRQARHEYPQRDIPYIEDLGRRAREYRLEGYVIGDTYMADRDRLIQAIEAPGPGTLVHPYLGTLTVTLTSCRVGERTTEGRLARFSFVFLEAGANVVPVAETDTGAAVETAAAAADAALQASFVRTFSVAGAPAFVEAAAVARVDEVATTLETAGARTGGSGSTWSRFRAGLRELREDATGLVREPKALAEAVQARIREIQTLASEEGLALTGLTTLRRYGQDLALIVQATLGRIREAANDLGLRRLVRGSGATTAATAAAASRPASYDEAVRLRDDLADWLDEVVVDLADAGDDETAAAVDAVRIAVVQDLTARGGTLARLRTVTPVVTLPALVLAHQLYGDATRADELVARNRIRHPGFVPGGRALEVLTDA